MNILDIDTCHLLRRILRFEWRIYMIVITHIIKVFCEIDELTFPQTRTPRDIYGCMSARYTEFSDHLLIRNYFPALFHIKPKKSCVLTFRWVKWCLYKRLIHKNTQEILRFFLGNERQFCSIWVPSTEIS